MFGLFRGTKEQFDTFVSWLNSLMPGVVKFTANLSYNQVEFLDLLIKIENGRLKTDLFIKPSNLQLYLNYGSNHPEPCKTGLVYGQALRVIERCTDDQDASRHLENLKQKLLEREYPNVLVEEQITRAKTKQRKCQIYQKKKTPSTEKVRLIFTHNENNPPIHQWIRQSKKFLDRNEKAKVMGQNIQIAYRQPKNLKQLVGGSRNGGEGGDRDTDVGCSKCKKKCHACKILLEGKTFQSTNTRKTYKIQQKINCQSSFIIYLGTCQKCHGQYIGKSTQPFTRRHSGHKQEIKNKIGGLGQHYGGNNGCGYENLRVTIIEQVEIGNHGVLAKREIYWQNQLRGFVENGGQAHCKRKEK